MTHPPTITFVVPALDEQETLVPLAEGISEHAAPWPHRILLIDDGSGDGSFTAMMDLRGRLDTVDVVRFSENVGKTAALAAGFARATGEVVITMDADLQDDPAEIPRFMAKLEEGFDVVCGWKQRRRDPWHKTLPSRLYNGYIALTFGLPLHDINTGFKAMRTEAARAVPMFGDMHRLIPLFAHHAGFRVGEIAVEHHPRRHGVSKYGVARFIHGARDVSKARLLTQCGGSVRPFVRVGMVSLGLLGAGVLASDIGGIGPASHPVLGTAGLLAGAVLAAVAAYCMSMARRGPGIVRAAREAAEPPIAEEHLGPKA